MIERHPFTTTVKQWNECFESHDPMLVDTSKRKWGYLDAEEDTYICDGPVHNGPAAVYYVSWREGEKEPHVAKAADAGASRMAHLLYERLAGISRGRGLTGITD